MSSKFSVSSMRRRVVGWSPSGNAAGVFCACLFAAIFVVFACVLIDWLVASRCLLLI